MSRAVFAVLAVDPLVLHNDEVDISTLQDMLSAGHIHHIILSPGPGTPHHPKDIGRLGLGLAWLLLTCCHTCCSHDFLLSTLLHYFMCLFKRLWVHDTVNPALACSSTYPFSLPNNAVFATCACVLGAHFNAFACMHACVCVCVHGYPAALLLL